jgi:HD superfamily phosphohydrolase
LAQKFAERLRQDNPNLVDEKDVICVMLAGLCHDLGHGPFSHLVKLIILNLLLNFHDYLD